MFEFGITSKQIRYRSDCGCCWWLVRFCDGARAFYQSTCHRKAHQIAGAAPVLA